MKKFEITKEQINELYNDISISNNSYRLKQWFPQAFESELEIGKWYTPLNECEGIALVCVQNPNDNDNFGYGFDWLGNWKDKGYTVFNMRNSRLATDKEVETALIAEAKRRGFKEGVFINNSNLGFTDFTQKTTGYKLWWDGTYLNFGDKNWAIFKDGKWAEIISEPIEVTLEQIAEKFNVNVEQLKIKK